MVFSFFYIFFPFYSLRFKFNSFIVVYFLLLWYYLKKSVCKRDKFFCSFSKNSTDFLKAIDLICSYFADFYITKQTRQTIFRFCILHSVFFCNSAIFNIICRLSVGKSEDCLMIFWRQQCFKYLYFLKVFWKFYLSRSFNIVFLFLFIFFFLF